MIKEKEFYILFVDHGQYGMELISVYGSRKLLEKSLKTNYFVYDHISSDIDSTIYSTREDSLGDQLRVYSFLLKDVINEFTS